MSRTLVLALCLIVVLMSSLVVPLWSGTDLHLSQKEVLETQGLSVLLFHNSYHHVFGDQKMSGLEMSGYRRLRHSGMRYQIFKSENAGSLRMKSLGYRAIRITGSPTRSMCARRLADFEWRFSWIMLCQKRLLEKPD